MIAKTFEQTAFHPVIADMIATRWSKISQREIKCNGPALKTAIGSLPAHARQDSLRTLLNGWTTSARMHGDPADCVFCGYPSGDSIEHYASPCEALLVTLAAVFPEPALVDGVALLGVSPLSTERAAFASMLYRTV